MTKVKSAVLFLVAIEVCVVAAADPDLRSLATAIADAVHPALSQNGRRMRRQDDCTDQQTAAFASKLPADCPIPTIGEFDAALFASLGSLCDRPECGNVIVEYFETCFGELGQNVGAFLIQLCAQNSNGERCYSSGVISSVDSTNTACKLTANGTLNDSCCQSWETTVTDVDCCINLLNVGGLVNATGLIQDLICPNITIPGPCGGSTLGGPTTASPTTAAGETVLGAVALVWALAIALASAAGPEP